MTGVLRWEEPPNRRQNKATRWAPVAAELRARPGEWAVIEETSNQTSTAATVQYVKKGDGPFAPLGAFDAISRTERLPKGPGGGALTVTKVYARYVGGAR